MGSRHDWRKNEREKEREGERDGKAEFKRQMKQEKWSYTNKTQQNVVINEPDNTTLNIESGWNITATLV